MATVAMKECLLVPYLWPACGKIHQPLNLLQTPGTVWASVAFSPFLCYKGKLLLTHQLFLAQDLKCFGDYCPPLGCLYCIKLYQEIILIININLKSNNFESFTIDFCSPFCGGVCAHSPNFGQFSAAYFFVPSLVTFFFIN